jgi:signal transduction histidine kinase
VSRADPRTEAGSAARIASLEEEVAALRRTSEVLMDRLERRMMDAGSAFGAFQVASNLERTVAERTRELQSLNERLEEELELRRGFEAALLRAKEQAEAATASRTRFVAAASHDLRQPLNAALLYLETIDRCRLSSKDAEAVDGVATALDTLNSLLSALLDISRLDSGGLHPEPAPFRLQPLFERLSREYGDLALARGLSLRVVPTGAVVNSDGMLLETVLRNLLSNAIKYTDRGKVLLGVRRRGGEVAFQVSDTGRGIEPTHRGRIFDEFWRAPGSGGDSGGSMGLGLSIVERICRLLGTAVEVASTPGRGSSFSFTLPAAAASPGEGAARSAAGAASFAGFGQRVVVVVDDNWQVLRSMQRLLESWDCRVVAGAGVEEVLTTLIDEDIAPALLLTDYHLGDGPDGVDAVAMINLELARAAPALMISSDNSAAVRERVARSGIPLLTKPIEPARLRAAMQHLLAG